MDRLKPGTKAFINRQERWKHNSFKGYATSMKTQARTIVASRTATLEAKKIAHQIESLALDLNVALNKRIGQ